MAGHPAQVRSAARAGAAPAGDEYRPPRPPGQQPAQHLARPLPPRDLGSGERAARPGPDPVQRQVQLVRVQREHLRRGRARVVQHPPQRVLPQASGSRNRASTCDVVSGVPRTARVPQAQASRGVGLDPALLPPPAACAAQRGQLAVGAARAGVRCPGRELRGKPSPVPGSSSSARGATGGAAPRRAAPRGAGFPTSGQAQLASEIRYTRRDAPLIGAWSRYRSTATAYSTGAGDSIPSIIIAGRMRIYCGSNAGKDTLNHLRFPVLFGMLESMRPIGISSSSYRSKLHRGKLGVLGKRDFRRFYVGYSASLLGTAMSSVAIAFAVLGAAGRRPASAWCSRRTSCR